MPKVWSDSSVVRELAGSARGPWFESRSGHVLFSSSSVTFGGSGGSVLGLRAAKGLSYWFWHGSEQIRGRIY